MREDQRSGCPINLTLEVVGDKWSLLIIRDMIFGNRRHFRELLTKSEEGIASNILADRLKTLVQAAQSLALRNGHQQLTPLHLLKVLLDDEERLAVNLVEATGSPAAPVVFAAATLLLCVLGLMLFHAAQRMPEQ